MCIENLDMAHLAIELLKEVGVGYNLKTEGKYFLLASKVHPALTVIYHRIYQMGRRVPSHHDFKLLDWEAMAIMYMCDGNIQAGGSRWYPMLNFCKWSYPELCWVKVQMKEYLGVDVNIYKCGKYWRLGVPAKDCDKFFQSVTPFMLPSFSYKIPNGRPHIKLVGGEIVRPIGQPMEPSRDDLAA
jgi:hypothetical protein